jgi:DNA-directed RNA polymerase specialized sigma24 family protein
MWPCRDENNPQPSDRLQILDQIRFLLLGQGCLKVIVVFRTVFVMRDIEEASTEETASVLGIRQQTVKTSLHRARRMLRAALASTLGQR